MPDSGKPWRARLAEAIEFPEDTFGGVPCLSMYGNTTLVVDGCSGVISYTDNEAQLRLQGLTLVIRGKSLVLHTFFDRSIKVGGVIDALEFNVNRS